MPEGALAMGRRNQRVDAHSLHQAVRRTPMGRVPDGSATGTAAGRTLAGKASVNWRI